MWVSFKKEEKKYTCASSSCWPLQSTCARKPKTAANSWAGIRASMLPHFTASHRQGEQNRKKRCSKFPKLSRSFVRILVTIVAIQRVARSHFAHRPKPNQPRITPWALSLFFLDLVLTYYYGNFFLKLFLSPFFREDDDGVRIAGRLRIFQK